MSRMSYKHALRAKGIKPIPPYHRLRSSKVGEQVIETPQTLPRKVGKSPLLAMPYGGLIPLRKVQS